MRHWTARLDDRRLLMMTLVFVVAGLGTVRQASAGMPSLELTDISRMRVQAFSFFLVMFLLLSAAVRWLWNWMQEDFPRLPRLSYKRAMGLVGLWGLLFMLILLMISGARELLTPGAWEPNGVTYRLRNSQLSAEMAAR